MSVRYDNVPAGFLALPPDQADPATADAVVLPVPYEGTVSYRSGTRYGPQAIIQASRQVELWDARLRLDYGALSVATLPELASSCEGPAAEVERVRDAVAEQVEAGRFVCMLGGEHSISSGAIEAHLARWPAMGVLQVDAHADLRDSYEGTPYSHAAVMRRVRERVDQVAQVGVRSITREEHEAAEREGWALFFAWDLSGDWLDRVLARLPEDVYVTFDVDGLDPSVMPGTGTPEPGGMSWHQAVALLERVGRERRIVGCDVVEVAPEPGSVRSEFAAARLAAALIGLGLEGRSRGAR